MSRKLLRWNDVERMVRKMESPEIENDAVLQDIDEFVALSRVMFRVHRRWLLEVGTGLFTLAMLARDLRDALATGLVGLVRIFLGMIREKLVDIIR